MVNLLQYQQIQRVAKMKISRSITILAVFSFLFVFSSYCGELKKKSDDKKKKGVSSSAQEGIDKKTTDIEDNGEKKDTEEGKDTILDVFLDSYVFITKKDKTYYHTEKCLKLEGKEIEKVKLSDLKKKGKYKPCKTCDPPVYTE